MQPPMVDVATLENELTETRARLARIIGAADEGLASVRRRARMRRLMFAHAA